MSYPVPQGPDLTIRAAAAPTAAERTANLCRGRGADSAGIGAGQDGFNVIAGHNLGVHGAVMTGAFASRFDVHIEVTTDWVRAADRDGWREALHWRPWRDEARAPD